MNIRTKYFFSIILFVAYFNCCDGAAKKPKPCGPDDKDPTCWAMQTEKTRAKLKKHNDDCTIYYPKDKNNNTIRDFDNHSLVIDECMDEDNRNFMECVLTFIGSGVAYKNNTGKCHCYREWPTTDTPYLPAHDHNLNIETSSEDWFVYDEKLKECVILQGKKCSPVGQEIVPYRCEKDSRCMILDNDDPRYDICSITDSTGSIKLSPIFNLSLFAVWLISTQ